MENNFIKYAKILNDEYDKDFIDLGQNLNYLFDRNANEKLTYFSKLTGNIGLRFKSISDIIYELKYTYKGVPLFKIIIRNGTINRVLEIDLLKSEDRFPKIYYDQFKHGKEYHEYHDMEELYYAINKCLKATIKKFRLREKIKLAEQKSIEAENTRQEEIRKKRQSAFYQEFINS